MPGLLAIGMAVCSALCATHILALIFGFPGSLNKALAFFDAALVCVYLAVELGHGGGKPSNRSGL
jgi:hypothetical protein